VKTDTNPSHPEWSEGSARRI